MAKAQVQFVCTECAVTSVKWQGQCASCGAWNSLVPGAAPRNDRRGYSGQAIGQKLADIDSISMDRLSTGIGELDRVLGGGLVPGSVVLIGGDPGIGKSTLLLQACAQGPAGSPGARRSGAGRLYVSGEESLQQLALRADRLGLDPAGIAVLAATCVEEIVSEAEKQAPACLVIDSIQTMYTDSLPSAPGSVNQLRDCTAHLVRMAKASGIAVLLVGHVTKEGHIAGPRTLEHMVDVVLYFENESGSRFRVLRAVKNRFGAANELGIFVMTETGMREVRNPSAIFVSRHQQPVSGSVVTVVHEGSRPLLVEVQALTDHSGGGPPRRLAVGMDRNRLALLLAVLNRHAGVRAHDDDVFVNVVGGVRITETAADLAVLAATASSISEQAVPGDTVIFGEVGLAGEIRPVAYGEERLLEAAKLGFKRAIAPRANLPRRAIKGMELVGVDTLSEALQQLGEYQA